MNNNSNNDNNNDSNGTKTPKKPRQSIKVEGNCLHNMLREGYAKVTDASRLGKRLSSEIWNSFGAIQVPDDFTNPSIETMTIADGPSTVKICHYFVACGKCFSVFKYDGHAYGTTGLSKHLKNCQGTNNQRLSGVTPKLETKSIIDTNNSCIDHSDEQLNSSDNNNINDNTNRPITTRVTQKRKRDSPTNSAPATRTRQPSIRQLVRVIEDLRNEQIELKQKIQEMLNLMGPGIMIINQGDQVEETLQKTN